MELMLRRYNMSIYRLASWLLITSIVLPLQGSPRAESLCLIRKHVLDERYSRFTVIIDSLETSTGRLAKMWSLPEKQCYINLKLYAKSRVLLVGTARNPVLPVENIIVIPFDSVSTATTLDLKFLDWVIGERYWQSSTGERQVEVEFRSQHEILSTWLDVSSCRPLDADSASVQQGRFEREGADYCSEGNELVSVSIDADGYVRTSRDSILIGGSPVPDGVIRRKTSHGWNQIANEPELRLLESVAEKGDYSDRELLIYDRLSDTWHSMVVPGISTSLRLLNGWVVGVVADDPPGVDYVNRHGGAPIPREEVVFVKPIEGRQFTDHIGPDPAILWVEGDILYFRTDDELYRARIDSNGIRNRRLIKKDQVVREINWAFTIGH